jgi:hypothetical protein
MSVYCQGHKYVQLFSHYLLRLHGVVIKYRDNFNFTLPHISTTFYRNSALLNKLRCSTVILSEP